MRGVHRGNPVCFCKEAHRSRAQVAGETGGQRITRVVHFRCATGECNFWQPMVDSDGRVKRLIEGALPPSKVESMGL